MVETQTGIYHDMGFVEGVLIGAHLGLETLKPESIRDAIERQRRSVETVKALVEACQEMETWAMAHVSDRNINKGTWLDRLLAKTSAALAAAEPQE